MAEEVINRIIRLQEDIRGTDESALRERVYVCVANSCILLNSYINSKGQKGWSTRLIDDQGQPILSNNEQNTLENIFAKAPWLLDFFKSKDGITTQIGGAVSDDEVSLDAAFNSVVEKTREMDEYWKKMESDPKAFGPIKKILNTNPLVTPVGILPVSVRLVTKLLITVLDLIRLGMARSGKTSVPLTLIIFLEELVTGQWRLMLLTAASLFITPSGVASTIMIKYLVMAWLTFGTDSQKTKLIKDVFNGSKSTIVNLIVYAYVLLTPTAIKGTMFNMPGDEVSYDVIQSKLLLLDSRPLLCSPAAMDLVKELKGDPFLGLVSELLNIPSVEKLEIVCRDTRAVKMASVADAVDLVDDLDDIGKAPPLPPRPSLTQGLITAQTQLQDQALAGATKKFENFKTANPILAASTLAASSLLQAGGRKTKKMNKRHHVKKSRKHGHRRH